VVTLQTWEARPKRLYFTEEDLELTIDFFHHGMSGIVQPGQRVLILMPGERPGSVGDLLVHALARMDVEGIVHGLVQDPGRTVKEILEKRVDCLVGIPVQVLSLARHKDGARMPQGLIKSVLLSSDYVAEAIVDELTQVWRCQVFEHYGMTEMGLGGGVQCSVHEGYHFREADFFFEIIDPDTTRPVPEGRTGEVVFTTLTRKGMPLIRYRTGDMARFIPEPCPCGTMLKRMGRIEGRLTGAVVLGKGHELSISDLDDVIFTVPGLLDYQAEVYGAQATAHLQLKVYAAAGALEEMQDAVLEAITRIRSVKSAVADGSLVLGPIAFGFLRTGAAKRRIMDRRGRD
jgi:phenylacetate-coenzyme A ligase PaaK-like adenylate-forming protein